MLKNLAHIKNNINNLSIQSPDLQTRPHRATLRGENSKRANWGAVSTYHLQIGPTSDSIVAKPSVSSLESDIATKEELKYNPELERMAKKWIEDVTGEVFQDSFVQSLRSGVLLCKYFKGIYLY